MIVRKQIDKNIEKILLKGGIGVLPTDTIYGLVGSALSKKTVEKIYKIRHRHPKKPMIILISSLAHLNLFCLKINKKIKRILRQFWPGPVSIILPCPYKKLSYLHRGTKTLAFRLPKKKSLINLLKITGPLVAPSANLEGQPSAKTIKEAQKYFGKKIDFYVNGGKIKNKSSTLIQIKDDQIISLR